MSHNSLTILGTSAQVPTKDRNHSGYFLQWKNEGILIDPGEGTQRQIRKFGIKPSKITKIIISHFHGDHCLGLPGIIQRLCLDGIQHSVQIYYPASGEEFLQNLIHASDYRSGIELILNPIEENGIIFESSQHQIDAFQLNHPIDCFGFRFQDKGGFNLIPERLVERDIKGKQIGELVKNGILKNDKGLHRLEEVSVFKKGNIFAFITDSSSVDIMRSICRQADILLCEATYLSEHKKLAFEYGHMTAEDAARLAKNAGVVQLVLSHFSQRYSNFDEFIVEASHHFPMVDIANDGDEFPFPRHKRDISS